MAIWSFVDYAEYDPERDHLPVMAEDGRCGDAVMLIPDDGQIHLQHSDLPLAGSLVKDAAAGERGLVGVYIVNNEVKCILVLRG